MPLRDANAKLRTSLGFVSSLMGGLSLISLLTSGFKVGWVEPLRKVVEQYLVLTNTVRHVVEPYVVPAFNALAEAMNIRLLFGPRWPDVFLLMLIYLGSRVKSYMAGGKYVRAAAMLTISVATCITSAFFASSVDLETPFGVLAATSIPLLGFVAYDAVYACVGASLDHRRQGSWASEFKRHLLFSVPLVLLSLVLNLLLATVFARILRTPYQAFVLIFAIDYAVISGYWAVLSLKHAKQRQNRLLGESTSQRFWRSSATNVSLNVALVLFSAVLFMLLNAGLQAAGSDLSQLAP
jgi:hypothetical protein